MPFIVAGLFTIAAGLFAYRTLSTRMRRRRPFDAGVVSDDWLAQHKHPRQE